MGTTTGRITADRRLRPGFDHLEFRMALSGSSSDPTVGFPSSNSSIQTTPSGSSLSIVSTSPANSAVVTSSPTTLLVTFDRPIDGFTLGNGDFTLMHVGSDGSTSPLLPGEAQITESLDPDDPTGSTISLSLSNGLSQGTYELLLGSDNAIQGEDGSMLASTGSAQVISKFSYSQTQTGRASAIDLQTLGPIVTTVSGNLNLATDPGAVSYYKFEVAPGHHWLVGLEVSALDQSNPFASTISLFDGQGHLIATDSDGLSSDPNDPYLFQGLDPGTYYVGVSAQRNIPDSSGSYDPGQSGFGEAGSGGPFQLDLVADPADQAVQVLGLRVDHADPLSTSPTGLTVQFSGGLALSSLDHSSQPPLELIDQNGNAWSLTPIGYNATNGQLSLAFDEPLAPGSYTLELASSNSLLDLSGRVPTAKGLPAGTLGSFTVSATKSVPGDLGPIVKGLDDSGIGSTVQVTSGGATTESFVVLESGVYAIQGVSPTSGVQFSVEDQEGHVLVTGPGDNQSGELDVPLSPGVYKIVLTTTQPSASISLLVRQKQNLLDSLIESGVGQGPALNLRLVTPQTDFGQSTGITTDLAIQGPLAPPAPTTQPSAPSSSTSSSTAQASSSPVTSPSAGVSAAPSSTDSGDRASSGVVTVAVGLATPTASSPAIFLIGNGPVGRPSSQSSQISVVGTSGPLGLASIASSLDSLPSGLIVVPVEIDGGPINLAETPRAPESDKEGPLTPRSGATTESGLLAQTPGSRLEDDRTLAGADWIGRLVDNAFDWLEVPAVNEETKGPALPLDVPGLLPVLEPSLIQESRAESASLTSPLGIGVVLGTIAYGYARKFLRQKPVLAKPGPKSSIQPILAGPHRRPRVRVH